jgi:general secretion pathway protein H
MVRTQTLTTGSRAFSQAGFTLVEIVAAISLVAVLLGVAAPLSVQFYESYQYRTAARESMTLLKSARYNAIAKGIPQDVMVYPAEHAVRYGPKQVSFSDDVELAAQSAKELNQDGVGVIRFYPDGGASGGGIDIWRGDGDVTQIHVDWLVGRVTLNTQKQDGL